VPCSQDVFEDFGRARVWTAEDFPAEYRINVGPDAVSDFKIIRTPLPLNAMLHSGALTMSMAGDGVAFHAMLNASVAHIHIGGASVAPELLIPWVGLLSGGAYFPTIHWDTDWMQFPTAAGFQVWCMVRSHAVPREGGVFVVTTSELSKHDPPIRFEWHPEDGTISKLQHTEDRPEYPMRSYTSAREANLTFNYMDLAVGDCLLWSKRTLHMSDPRPHLRGGVNERVASHLRVAVRATAGGPIDYWPNHPYAKESGSMMWRLRKQSRKMERKRGYHQLYVDGDELIERNPSNLFGSR